MSEKQHGFFHNLDLSAFLTILGIALLFSGAVIVTLIAPRYMDPSWVEPASVYQVQMYEVADPHIYISKLQSNSSVLQAVYHLERNHTLLSFRESETVRIVAPQELEKYVTRYGDPSLKLTSRLMLLRSGDEMSEEGKKAAQSLQAQALNEKQDKLAFDILELYTVEGDSAFALASVDRMVEDWVDKGYTILDEATQQPWHQDPGVIYVHNPIEYRVKFFKFGQETEWIYDPAGQPIANVSELEKHPLGFHSRKELIAQGEKIYAIEGCWYCHTDQTRTLVQDLVLNGSDSYPAPPSSANEYIYQQITFPGTRRIGPDMSRVGVKRPSRDWHKAHFWSPKTASKGSIMPSFRHFFDDDPRGTSDLQHGIPNYKFEALFQYLMTKGTRMTPPTQAWWLGKDSLKTQEIIEGKKRP